MKMTRFASALIWGVMLGCHLEAGAAPSGGPAAVTLKLSLQPGMTWKFESSQEFSSQNEALLNGRRQPFVTRMNSRRSGRAEILSVQGGVPDAVRVTYDDNCETVGGTSGQSPQKIPFPFAGRTVVVRRNADGSVSDDFSGPVEPATRAELHAVMEHELAMLPKTPVGVGEEWTGDNDHLGAALELQGKDHGGMTLKLLSVQDLSGRSTAEVKVSIAIERDQNGLTTQIVVQGTAWVDVASGHLNKIQLRGTTQSNGEQSAPGYGGQMVRFHMEGKGELKSASSTEWVTLPTGGKPPTPTGLGAAPEVSRREGGLPSGYVQVAQTESGRMLTRHRDGAESVRAALGATLVELARYFDDRPKVQGAYEDQRDHRSGGATFVAKQAGQAVQGHIGCTLKERSADVVVTFCRADAPRAEWERLTVAQRGQTAGAGPGTVPALKTYSFPDGTGSIGLAPGWTTQARTLMGRVILKGPDDQAVTLGTTLSVSTPNSMAVHTQQQLLAQARQLGGPPPALPPILVARFDRPIRCYEALVPQLSRMSQANGGPPLEVRDLTLVKSVPGVLANSSADLVTLRIQLPGRQGRRPFKSFARLEITPISNDAFMFGITDAAAPEETFEQDLPVMLAMIGSVQENAAQIQQQTDENIRARKEWFAVQQRTHQELTAAYEQQHQDWRRRSNDQSRSVTDFNEVIIGQRTVLDTTTGEKTKVDLGHVDQIVDRLNEVDPGRYQQIPLRDELFPR
jgi:hypothetical protein